MNASVAESTSNSQTLVQDIDSDNAVTSLSRLWTDGVDNVTKEVIWQDPLSPDGLLILTTTPIVFCFGLSGNFLSALVMRRGHFRSLSTGVYLFCLAIADTIFLSVNSMTKNFLVLSGLPDLTKVSDWSCKMYVYLLMTAKCLSAWFIVAVTVERLIVICVPHKAKLVATRRNAWIAIAVTTVTVSLVYLVILITFQLRPRPWGMDCTMHEDYTEMGLRVMLNTTDLVVYSFVPSVALFVSNIVLIVKVVQSRNLRRQNVRAGSDAGGQAMDDVTKLTITLVLVSVVFLVCTLPISMLFLLKAIVPTIKDFDDYYILYRCLYTLQLSNSAINFLLYCLSGPAFRNELRYFFRCGTPDKSNVPTSVKLNAKGKPHVENNGQI